MRGWLIVIDADAKPIRISALQLIGASPYSVVGYTAGASDHRDNASAARL